MKKSTLFFVVVIIALVVTACQAQPEPIIKEVVEEVVVTSEVEVEVVTEVEVEVTKEVIEEVEVEKVVEVEVAADLANRGTFRISHGLGWGGTENLDPVNPAPFLIVNRMIYDRLAIIGQDGSPVPSLASSWSSNDTADEWTFNLREGVKFHDGSDLTSADVAYSVSHWQNETSVAAAIVAIIESVETPDDLTVVMKLGQPHADLPLLVNLPIIPEDSADTIATSGIGSGPYMVETLDVLGTTILVPNDNYWGGPPGMASVEVIGIADVEAQMQAFLAGQLDWIDMTLPQAELAEAQGGFDVISFPSGGWSAFIMRTDIEPFNNAALRRAMRVVADRQEMVDVALGGAGVVACDTPVKANDQYRFDTDCSQNIEEAQALLEEAGYNGETITLHISDFCPDWTPLAEVYQQQAALAGIDLEIQVAPTDGYWTDVWMVEPFTATCWTEAPADQILNQAFTTGSPWNETYWSNEAFDAALSEARSELDFDARKAAYQQAQQLIWEDGGALIPYHNESFRATTRCVLNAPAMDTYEIDWVGIGVTPGCAE